MRIKTKYFMACCPECGELITVALTEQQMTELEKDEALGMYEITQVKASKSDVEPCEVYAGDVWHPDCLNQSSWAMKH